MKSDVHDLASAAPLFSLFALRSASLPFQYRFAIPSPPLTIVSHSTNTPTHSYFSKLPTASPIQRGSWGLEIDTPLFMPPGDPHEKYREVQLPETELPLSRIHLRVDWQTLRRLPLSGAIIFNFKALFTPVEDFRQ